MKNGDIPCGDCHRKRMLPRQNELFCLLLALCHLPFVASGESASAAPVSANESADIQHAQDFWVISGPARDQPHDFHKELRINFEDTAWSNFWYEEQGEPGYLPLSRTPPTLKAGQQVKLDGTVIPSVGLEASRIKVTTVADPDPTPAEEVKGRFNQMLAMDR